MYPPIIDKALYERVQKRLNKNKYYLGGQNKAKLTYLLSGKLFCGHCGTEMVSDGGVSRLQKTLNAKNAERKKMLLNYML